MFLDPKAYGKATAVLTIIIFFGVSFFRSIKTIKELQMQNYTPIASFIIIAITILGTSIVASITTYFWGLLFAKLYNRYVRQDSE